MNNPLTRERRDALRGIAADDRHAMTVLAADMLALLDAADERDELQARLDLAGGAPRTVPGVMEHGDTLWDADAVREWNLSEEDPVMIEDHTARAMWEFAQEIQRLTDACARVGALHADDRGACSHCGRPWPCPTIDALSADLVPRRAPHVPQE